jgi:butyrate kinase
MSVFSLIINPGSTSTKIGVFEDETLLFDETLRHATEEISKYATIIDQKDFRKDIIISFLKEKNFDINSLNVVVGRGGLLKPIPSGTYAVTEELLADLKSGARGQHASNLGGILAKEIADTINVPAYIVDPVVVDEMEDVARYSGLPELPRTSIFHALNQKAVAKRYAKESGIKYEDLNLIVIHLGGGVSVGPHKNGKIIDIFNALDGDGAFSPERAGSVPSGALVKMCFSGQYTEKEVMKKLVGNGGFNAYLGTNDMREVNKMIAAGDEKAAAVREAFIYNISKNVGAMATVLKGKVDQIIVTGGIAYNADVIADLKERCEWIAPFTVYPGEDELLALAQGALRVMSGDEEACVY